MTKASDSLTTLVNQFGEENAKFEKGNHSAGIRARKVLQTIKKTCSEIKAEMLASEASKAGA